MRWLPSTAVSLYSWVTLRRHFLHAGEMTYYTWLPSALSFRVVRCTFLGDILDSDSVSVGFGGFSVGPVLEGLPEGGCLSPLLYPLIPNSLTRVLLHEKCGVALDAALPKTWKDHQWSGQGVPQMSLVARILEALHADAQLPTSSALQAYPDLEASAARALDLRDPGRLAILLHADDPVLLASSWGELCRMILMIERWAPGHGARFHVSDDKSVVFRLGESGQVQPIFFRPSPSAPSTSLSLCSDAHRWLGWLWTEAGGAAETLQARIRVASGCFSTLAGLCTSQAIPLPFALNIFEGKVDACMRPGMRCWSRTQQESLMTRMIAGQRSY